MARCTVATLGWEDKIWPEELLYAATDTEDKGQTCLICGWKVQLSLYFASKWNMSESWQDGKPMRCENKEAIYAGVFLTGRSEIWLSLVWRRYSPESGICLPLLVMRRITHCHDASEATCTNICRAVLSTATIVTQRLIKKKKKHQECVPWPFPLVIT